MLLHLAQAAGGALMDGWALWFVGALVIGALLLARDEWRLARQASRRKRKEGTDGGEETGAAAQRVLRPHWAHGRAANQAASWQQASKRTLPAQTEEIAPPLP